MSYLVKCVLQLNLYSKIRIQIYIIILTVIERIIYVVCNAVPVALIF